MSWNKGYSFEVVVLVWNRVEVLVILFEIGFSIVYFCDFRRSYFFMVIIMVIYVEYWIVL